MKQRIFMVISFCLMLAGEASAQKRILIYGPSMAPGIENEQSLCYRCRPYRHCCG